MTKLRALVETPVILTPGVIVEVDAMTPELDELVDNKSVEVIEYDATDEPPTTEPAKD